jgi:AcrR family transcriptional regulator
VAEIAEAADVSRRTIYQYFPTLEHLLLDATLGAIARETIEDELDPSRHADDIEARLDAVVRAVQRGAANTEREGRTLIRLTIDPRDDGETAAEPRRGYRRVEWIERALAPLRDRVDAARFERLVSALVMVVGWEALFMQRDIRALTPAEGEEVSAWVARALLRATLDEP